LTGGVVKKTLFLLMLLSGLLASCTTSELQPTTNSDETIVGINTTKESKTPEGPTPESVFSFVQPEEVEDNLAGKERWAVGFGLPQHFDNAISYTYSRRLLPRVTDANSSQQIFYGKGYAYDDTSFYLPSQGRIVAIDSISGLEKWQSETSGYVLAVGEDTVFVLTDEERIYGLDKKNGEVKWKIILELLFEEDTYIDTAAIMHKIEEKYVLILTTHYYYSVTNPSEHFFWLLQVDEKTGDYALIQAPELNSTEIPFFYSDNLIVAEQEDTNTFMGINYANGKIIWQITRPEGVYTDGFLHIVDIDIKEKILYLLSENYSTEIRNVIFDLNAIDIMTGNLIWGGSIAKINNSLGIGIFDTSCDLLEKYLICKTSPFDDQNEVVYNLYDRKTGQLLNSFTPERWHEIYVSENGLIVYYSEVGIIQGIDYLTGEVLWQDDEEEWSKLNRDYFYYEDVILVEDSNGNNLAIDQRTGNHLWTKDDTLLGTFEDKFLFRWCLVDPISGEEQKISLNTKFGSDSLIELSGRTLILSDFGILALIDLAK